MRAIRVDRIQVKQTCGSVDDRDQFFKMSLEEREIEHPVLSFKTLKESVLAERILVRF
jgi:hypothetical protein